ncbi:MAG: bifunctional 2-polyprenyl-6-hydroxyphenol methylase/3-demethylubiquinol 3-O-methyltransferase UbiG [Pseudomonadota bacterium]
MLRKDELKPIRKPMRDDAAPGRSAGLSARTTSDAAEVARFNELAEEWWRPDGKFKVVHAFNAARVTYLKSHLADLFPDRHLGSDPLAGLKVADIGCGAGLVSEPMAAAGADVFAIDAAERNIAIARHHAAQTGVAITYAHSLPEQLGAEHQGAYDVVMSLEVVEHVSDLQAFLSAIGGLVRPGGYLVIGTLNRTAKSFAFGIVGAEYILQLLPRGTHDWRKFVQPEELTDALKSEGFRDQTVAGVQMNPMTFRWSIGSDIKVNYLKTLAKAP